MRPIVTVLIAAAALAALTVSSGPPAEAGGGCHNEIFSDQANTQVELSKNCFEPTVVRVAHGDTVTWTNGDPDPHTVTGAANTWGSGDKINAGASVSYQFDESGVFPYFCYFHPSMVGAVVVGDGGTASAGPPADAGVKAVSAEAPGGAAGDQPAEVLEEDGGGVDAAPIAIGVGVLAVIGGFAGALVLRRRTMASE